MKAVVIAACVLALGFSPSASSIPPGTYKVNLQAVRIHSDADVTIYALYNRPTYPQRLGTAFSQCHTLSAKYADCYISLLLTRGQIAGRSVVPRNALYRSFAIAGGTGFYANIGGEMSVVPVGKSVFLITAVVQGF